MYTLCTCVYAYLLHDISVTVLDTNIKYYTCKLGYDHIAHIEYTY